jgi:chorismate synthase
MHLRFTTAGESHGKAYVAIVEGLPAGLPISAEAVDRDLARRMQGYGRGARMKIERDRIEWLSGVRAGETLGSPVAMLIANRDWANWEDVMAHEASEPGELRRRRVSSTIASTRATSWSAPARARRPRGSPPAPSPSGCSRSSGWKWAATW